MKKDNYKKRSLPRVFFTYDPLNREVICTENTWDKIKINHPEVRNIRKVERTIEKPDVIATDKTKPTTENYYSFSGETLIPDEKYTKVCVNFEEKPAKIVTSYRTANIHSRDKTIWTR
jgi:hypothetical protein